MYTTIFQIALLLGCGVIVYLFVKKMPKVGEDVIGEGEAKRKVNFPKLKVRMENVDKTINSLLEKALRKIKLLLMRLDNATTDFLGRVKESGELKIKRVEKKSLFAREGENEEGDEK